MVQVQRGFTLIELMITVAILGIIAAVAIPSYNSMVTKSRRADAKTALSEIAQLQESYYADNNRYAQDLTDLQLEKRGYQNVTTSSADSKEGYYEIRLSGNPRNFTLTAIAQGMQDQKDGECKQFSLTSSGKKSTVPPANSAKCW